MSNEEIKFIILTKMERPTEDRSGYTASDLGYLVFGQYRGLNANGSPIPRRPQGAALAIGKHLRKMMDEGYLTRRDYVGSYNWFKTPKGQKYIDDINIVVSVNSVS